MNCQWSGMSALLYHLTTQAWSLGSGFYPSLPFMYTLLSNSLARLRSYPHRESNPDSRIKSPLHSPLCYRGMVPDTELNRNFPLKGGCASITPSRVATSGIEPATVGLQPTVYPLTPHSHVYLISIPRKVPPCQLLA